VEESIRKLWKLNYNLDILDTGEWQGRAVYIAGAKNGDETTKQLWIDKERMLLVRTLERNPQNPEVISEVRMGKHVQMEGAG
jgi:hypothetical protein